MIVCFNGIDGSGKSLQAQRLVEHLNEAGYPAVYVWNGTRAPVTRWFTRLIKRMLGVTKVTAPSPVAPTSSSKEYRSYLTQTQQIFKRPLVRNIWLHKSLLEHTVEIWARVLPHLLRGRIVVCDRYIFDTVISISVLSNLNPEEVARLLRVSLWYPVPRPTNWFFLDVAAEVGFQRKDDVPDLLFLERRVPLYRTAAAILGMECLDGTALPDEIAVDVLQRVQTTIQTASLAVSNRR